MAQLQSTNVVGTLCVNGVAIGGGKDFKFCCFTGSSTFTPSSDLVDGDGVIDTFMVGGGGSGGAALAAIVVDCRACTGQTRTATSGPGGGGGVSHTLQNITSTDVCTVTVGAGGQAPKPGIGCNVVQQLTVPVETESGGDSSFGNATAYGGGGGVAARSVYSGCCPNNGAADSVERNGGSANTYGGGADLRGYEERSYFAWGGINGYYGATTCNFYQAEKFSNDTKWDSDILTSSYYNFSPDHTCSCGKDNNGIIVPGDSDRRVGTNAFTKYAGYSDKTCLSVCYCTTNGQCCVDNLTQQYHCGAGGAASYACVSACKNTDNNNTCQFAACVGGGAGSDGLVILKWYE